MQQNGNWIFKNKVMLTQTNGFVLANNSKSYTPWVTWWFNGETCYYGHYFVDYEEAYRDLWKRVATEANYLASL